MLSKLFYITRGSRVVNHEPDYQHPFVKKNLLTNSHAVCSTRVKRRFNAILSNLLQVYKCVTKKAIYELISQGHCIPVSLQICFTALKKKVLMEVSYTHTHSWSHFE